MPTQYLTNKKTEYKLLDAKQLQDQPLLDGSKLFVFPAGDNSNELITILTAKYPNGKLVPHYSGFNEKLLFYSFEVK